ncbi:DNA-binding transcriptional regulator, AcrR family [Jiangella alkaliphila]|uniref:DNA-binding transcriptional regulator, AcrR family n=1 Tax=Jiangella alkaliphila TaxID=419479 RepID=A0A1H2GJY5_9ACTN|nr:TetR/AcrR family transcriptional regulator [Jiangella alkaliphila]SDU19749.1 DNA-binding transcriptional regulator, AcrR family [Jiangella alkaliphila]
MSPTQLERRQATVHALLTEGRRQFAGDGYAAVSLAGIVDALGLTKGAFYHHFASKAALFRAVVEQVQAQVADRVVAAAEARPDAWGQLTAGCEAFLRAGADPDVQRIMLIDGPAVLGWDDWRALDDASSGRHLRDALQPVIDDGVIAPQPVEPLTHLLSGAMNEAALWLARSDDPHDLDDTVAALLSLLDALRLR